MAWRGGAIAGAPGGSGACGARGAPGPRGARSGARGAARAPLLALAVLVVAGLARPEAEAVALDYQAPAGCPGPEELLRRVQERTPHARAPRSGELARRYRVHVSAPASHGTTFRAVLSFVDRDGQPAERVVEGATCREAVDAIALVTALAIQARVEAESAASAASSVAPAPSASASAPPASAPPPAAPPPAAAAASAPGRQEEPPQPLRWSVLGAAVGATGVAPGLAWGPWVALGGWSGAASARLGVESLNGGLDDAGPGLMSYRLTAAVAEGCRRWAVGDAEPGGPARADRGIDLHACAVGRLGELRARALPGADIVRAADRGHLWGSLGAAGRADAWPVPGVGFSLTLGVEVVLNRREFYLTDVGAAGPRQVHALPPLALRLGAGMTVAP